MNIMTQIIVLELIKIIKQRSVLQRLCLSGWDNSNYESTEGFKVDIYHTIEKDYMVRSK